MINFRFFPQRDDLCRQMIRVGRLTSEARYDDALQGALKIEAACTANGCTSAAVLWAVAVAWDHTQNLPNALDAIFRAVHHDPIDSAINQSLEVILDKVRDRLLGEAWDEAAEGMYFRLVEEEITDDALRVAYAGHLLAVGKHIEALRVAQAVALLNPRCAMAWDVVEAAAEKLGDIALAMEAANSSAAAKVTTSAPKANMASARA